MKKILIITLLFNNLIFALSFKISTIPLPKTYIQDLDPYPCDELCLQDYLDKEMIFSFLSHTHSKLKNKYQENSRIMNIAILNIGNELSGQKVRIAILLPYNVIGKYASSTTNAAFAYLMARNHSFELKSYKINDESTVEIQQALKIISEDNFNYIIAPLTQTGASALASLNPEINIFVPTINRSDIDTNSYFINYGGIDYKTQSDLLLKEAVSPLIVFYDRSSLGKRLSLYEVNKFKNNEMALKKDKIALMYSIPKRTTNLKRQLKKNHKITNGSFFINTPIVKTGMIMTQLTLYDANATNVLSTQINYDPLLFSMTQYNDRKNMIIANSITQHNNILIEANSLLSNDIEYDWINYATTIGIDYYYNEITGEDRKYKLNILDNQVQYPIELLRPSLSKFVKYYHKTF